MNEAGSIVEVPTTSPWGDPFVVSMRILYWWEIQEIKLSSIIKDSISSSRFIDRSRLYGDMVDTFLEAIVDDGETMRRSDLAPGENWRQRLHPTIIKPIYDIYNESFIPTEKDLDEFRQQVKEYYDPISRQPGIYITPPEIWEIEMLSSFGGMTRSEIRKLSYYDMKKFLIIMEFSKGDQSAISQPMTQANDPFAGLIPMSMMSNPDMSSSQIKKAAGWS